MQEAKKSKEDLAEIRRTSLREEAASFYAGAPDDRVERDGYLSAMIESLSRD